MEISNIPFLPFELLFLLLEKYLCAFFTSFIYFEGSFLCILMFVFFIHFDICLFYS